MAKYEREIKVLDIDVESTRKKLEELNIEYKGKKDQKIYTYDVPCISTRYEEALILLNSKNELLQNTARRKLEIVLDEFQDLITGELLKNIEKELGTSIPLLFELNNNELYLKLKESKLLNKEIKKEKINPNKWVRLRQSNDKVELTVKHVYNNKDDSFQKVREIEINVSDLDEANRILEAIGLVRRNYQEKIRYSYKYMTAEIELDIWPKLEPYMEIECDDVNVIDDIIDKLEFRDKKIVSLNTERLYLEKGIDVLKISDLKF